MSVRRVFASGVGFVCLYPGGCVGVAGGGWCECVCWGWKLGEKRMLEADSCRADPTIFPAMSARAWGERFLVLSRPRISFRVGRMEEALRSRSSFSDFCILPYLSF